MTPRLLLAAALACALAGSAAAQVAKQEPVKKLKPAELAAAIAALAAPDDAAAAAAAAKLGEASEPAAHDALLDALAFGPPPDVAVAELAALVAHPAPADVVALRRYAGHHDPAVRVAAFDALAHYPDPTAHAAIVAGLHDAVGNVRSAAAAAAAAARVRDAVDPLFALLAKGEEPAARALAQLADPELARRIGDQLGQVPDPALAACLGAILKRPDFGPDAARVEVVRTLGKIADPSALAQLTDYLDATPKSPPRPSRAEAEKLVETKLGGGR